MPINELEQHPYLDYPTQFENQITSHYYKGIIIGSFPIYAVTDTINEDQEIVEERFNAEGTMRFFYGSRNSDLWKYVGLALANADPRKNENDQFLQAETAVKNCKQLLFQNELLISDSLYRTNRKQFSSDDSALMVQSEVDYVNKLKSVNYSLKDLLQKNRGVKNIYFTSTSLGAKSPYGWFRQIFLNQIQVNNFFQVGARNWSAIAELDFGNGDVRNFNLFFLPTPKPRGIHWNVARTVMFEQYLQTEQPDFYLEIDPIPAAMLNQNQKNQLSILRIDFLVECYKQAIVFGNLTFDGTNRIG